MLLHDSDHDGSGEHFTFPKPVLVRDIPLGEARINILIIPLYRNAGDNFTPENFKDLSDEFFVSLDNMIKVTVYVFFATHKVAVTKSTRQFAHDTYDPHSFIDGMNPQEYELRYEPARLTVSYWRAMRKDQGSPIEECLMSLNFGRYHRDKSERKKHSEEIRKVLAQPDLLKDVALNEKDLLKLFKQMASLGAKTLFGLSLLNSRVFKWSVSWVSNDIERGSSILPENDIRKCSLEYIDR